MKKIVSIMTFCILGILVSFLSIDSVSAASAKISVTGSKRIVVGNTIKVTVTVSSSSALGAWEFDMKYDSDKLTFVSSTLEGSTRSTGYVTNSSTKTKTYTLTFKAKKAGTAKIYVANSLVYAYDESKMSTTNGSLSVSIITQQQLQDSYSSNNNLKELSVDGYSLTPNFSKNVLEYSLDLENDVRSIKVNAIKEDSKASISGTGTHSLNEGNNNITITVTAENGKTKNYVIHANVKELNPIFVTVNGSELSVVRKPDGLNIPSTFVETKTMINEEEVLAFESSITGYRLIALKNDQGEINFYIMEEDGTYTKYEEIIFNGVTIHTIVPKEKDIPDGYQKQEASLIGEKEVTLYTSLESSYPIIYGMNIETGVINWYTYDAEEGTLQRFDNTRVEELILEKNKFLFLIVVLSGSSLIVMTFLLILCAKVRKIKNQKKESL